MLELSYRWWLCENLKVTKKSPNCLTLAQWHGYIILFPAREAYMIEFFPPILEHFCPPFIQIAGLLPRWVSFCPDRVLFCPEYHPHPLVFTLPSQTPFRDMNIHKTPPTPHQNTPFPGLNLKVGKINYRLGRMDLFWAKCLKNGQNFSRSEQKKIFMKYMMLLIVCLSTPPASVSRRASSHDPKPRQLWWSRVAVQTNENFAWNFCMKNLDEKICWKLLHQKFVENFLNPLNDRCATLP